MRSLWLAADRLQGHREALQQSREEALAWCVFVGGAGSKSRERSKTALAWGEEGGQRMGLVHPF